MEILKWLPPHAHQIRYTAPLYEEDEDGNSYVYNEDEYTEVWHQVIREVHKTKRPMYYRRRTIDLARRDRYNWQQSIYSQNNWQKDWNKNCTHVRVRVIGRRVLFIYDEEFVYKNWTTSRNKRELQDKIRKLKEGKFKNFGKEKSKKDLLISLGGKEYGYESLADLERAINDVG